MNNTKQTQDDRTIQPFNCLTIQRVKAYAFTLAETLIVIGIIGVVAALTLPNLNHATGNKETVTRVKKIYAALSEAFDRAQAIYGPYDEWTNDMTILDGIDQMAMSERVGKRVTEFMKLSKDCGFNSGCFTSGIYFALNGAESAYLDSYSINYRVLTADGMSLAFEGPGDAIYVDIDGPNKGQFTRGKDLFVFGIKNNVVVPDCSRWFDSDYINRIYYSGYIKDGQCTSNWILNFDNADYLNADYTTGKCNNSDIILDGVNNTSCH